MSFESLGAVGSDNALLPPGMTFTKKRLGPDI